VPFFNDRELLVYYQMLCQLTQNLRTVEIWLDKAEKHANALQTDIGEFLNGSLAPDMKPFIYQVQSATDYLKGGAAWLSGQEPPKYEDNESTIEETRERIRKTVSFVGTLNEEQFRDAYTRKVNVSWSPPGKFIRGENYLLQVVVPNVYFHISMAYAILRHLGIGVEKMDFVGPVKWVES
jgi:uncharacterized protein